MSKFIEWTAFLRIRSIKFALLFSLVFVIPAGLRQARAESISNDHIAVSIDAAGNYQVIAKIPNWTFAGHLPAVPGKIVANNGKDSVGDYHELSFSWRDGERPMAGSIRLYTGKDLVLFSDTLPKASPEPSSPFPDFRTVPAGLLKLSYGDGNFSPPQFNLKTTSSPWLLFDPEKNALLISPASHFLISTLIGDGEQQIACGFSKTLANVPAAFTQQTLLAFGHGINATYDRWGHALTDLQGKKRPANDADLLLKYYSYWTDNGAFYYYNYDPAKGYAGTLKALVDSYRQEGIPLHSLQLDSWWYHKSFTSPSGKEGPAKNPKLPPGDWNRYGGLMDYTAVPFVFPDGLDGFHKEVGLPFETHDRWIDPASPYHQRFHISGLAAVDPRFWDEIAAYMKASSIVTYEQDWMHDIFSRSPGLESTVDQGDAFLDNMARATKAQGETLQYCMVPPRALLQGSKYDNLTTSRTSGDRFNASKYHNFLYTSRFASALGIWPWCDVFNSGETLNLLLDNLSAGPVGTGDAIGQEDKANLFRAIRADGVIVKPDVPLVPLDSAYVAEAQGKDVPLEASTFTDHGDVKTVYAVAIRLPKSHVATFTLNPADLGLTGPAYFYDYFAGTARRYDPGQTLSGTVNADGVSFFIIAPVGRGGIAFLGDAGKFVSTGKQRIASLRDRPGELDAEVLLAPEESQVTLHGYADKPPKITARPGTAGPVQYDAATHHFSVTIQANMTAPAEGQPDPVRRLAVTFGTL